MWVGGGCVCVCGGGWRCVGGVCVCVCLFLKHRRSNNIIVDLGSQVA